MLRSIEELDDPVRVCVVVPENEVVETVLQVDRRDCEPVEVDEKERNARVIDDGSVSVDCESDSNRV